MAVVTKIYNCRTSTIFMNEIYEISGDKTLIMIAHRLSTLDKCDKTYILKDGKLYEQL